MIVHVTLQCMQSNITLANADCYIPSCINNVTLYNCLHQFCSVLTVFINAACDSPYIVFNMSEIDCTRTPPYSLDYISRFPLCHKL